MIYFTKSDVQGKHHHVAFIDMESRGGFLLEEKNHTHKVIVAENETGEQSIVVEPAEDGHTHMLVRYDPQDMPEKKKLNEKALVEEIKENFKSWYALDQDAIEKGKESLEYYKGNQHDEEGKNRLVENDRTCLTINEITPNIDLLLGYQKEHKTDWMVLPREEGDGIQAELSTELLKYVSDFNRYHDTESDVFRDIVVTGRGCSEITIDDEENLEGDIKITRPAWDEVVFAEHKQKDLSDCEGQIKFKYISEHKLKQIAPDLFDDDSDSPEPDSDKTFEATDKAQAMQSDFMSRETLGPFNYVDPVKKEYLVLERWLKVYREIPIVVSKDASVIFSLEGWRSGHVNKIKKVLRSGEDPIFNEDNFKIVRKRVTRMWVTTIAGDKILSNEYPANLPKGDFFTVPAYGYFYDGDWWGKIEAVKGSQDELNKRASQTVDIVNRMSVWIWFLEPDTFVNAEEQRKFFKTNTKPGSGFLVSDLNKLPRDMRGDAFPDGLVRLTELSSQRIARLLNVNPEQNEDYTSGQVYLLRKESKVTANQFLLDNLALMKAKVGLLTLSLIQQHYSIDRLDRIVNGKPKFETNPETGEQQEIPPKYSAEVLQEFKENVDLGKYDIVISEAEYAPSAILGMFATLSAMAERGLPIAPESLIMYAPVPEKMKQQVVSQIQGQVEAQNAEASAAQDSEVVKSLIGQGLIPPEIAEKYGIQDQLGYGQAGEVGQAVPPFVSDQGGPAPGMG